MWFRTSCYGLWVFACFEVKVLKSEGVAGLVPEEALPSELDLGFRVLRFRVLRFAFYVFCSSVCDACILENVLISGSSALNDLRRALRNQLRAINFERLRFYRFEFNCIRFDLAHVSKTQLSYVLRVCFLRFGRLLFIIHFVRCFCRMRFKSATFPVFCGFSALSVLLGFPLGGLQDLFRFQGFRV